MNLVRGLWYSSLDRLLVFIGENRGHICGGWRGCWIGLGASGTAQRGSRGVDWAIRQHMREPSAVPQCVEVEGGVYSLSNGCCLGYWQTGDSRWWCLESGGWKNDVGERWIAVRSTVRCGATHSGTGGRSCSCTWAVSEHARAGIGNQTYPGINQLKPFLDHTINSLKRIIHQEQLFTQSILSSSHPSRLQTLNMPPKNVKTFSHTQFNPLAGIAMRS